MNISSTLTRLAGRTTLIAQKHSPLILTTVGVAGLITAGILAAKATLKLEQTIDDGRDNLNWTKQAIEIGDKDERDLKKAVVHNYIQIAKLYAKPVLIGAGGVFCVAAGVGILKKQNAALMVAYNGLNEAFNKYRARVIEEHGEQADEDYRLGIRREEVVNKKSGEKTEKLTIDEHDGSNYVYDYGVNSASWTEFPEQNLFFLTQQQAQLNDMLKARHHVMLNEVLRRLGLPETRQGAVVGWWYDPHNPNHQGDNYIDFRMKDLQDTNGFIVLDFNVDGMIYDKLPL